MVTKSNINKSFHYKMKNKKGLTSENWESQDIIELGVHCILMELSETYHQ